MEYGEATFVRILIISDIHGNIAALNAVLHSAGQVDEVWNLGDIVGYGPDPSACIETVSSLKPSVSLVGNHDLASIGDLPISDFNPVAAAAATWTADQLSDVHRDYLHSLPSLIRRVGDVFAHGSPRDPVWEYVDSGSIATANFHAVEFQRCYVGHTHRASTARLAGNCTAANLSSLREDDVLELNDGRLLINPGSVGQPRDGDPRAAFAIVDLARNTLTSRRVAYDIEATQRAIVDAGLPAMLAERLAVGR